MDHIASLLVGGISFGKTIVGLVTRPYETCRQIVSRGTLWELPYIALFLTVYFALASIVKTASFRPFLLTKHFVALGLGAGGGFGLTVGLLWVMGRLAGGEGKIGKLALSWAYTLVPTILWFLTTSLLYVILPPPRTTSVLGILFSIVFLVFSITMLWWKFTLAYLSLRFAQRLDFARIFLVWGGTIPFLGLYSFFLYRWGIFKVPFL